MAVAVAVNREVELLEVPDVIIGGKSWCIDRFGVYLLQAGPGVMRALCCVHVGSAYMNLYDADPASFSHHTARTLLRMNPTILGCWMLDAGFNLGLIVEIQGTVVPAITLVWAPYKDRPRV